MRVRRVGRKVGGVIPAPGTRKVGKETPGPPSKKGKKKKVTKKKKLPPVKVDKKGHVDGYA